MLLTFLAPLDPFYFREEIHSFKSFPQVVDYFLFRIIYVIIKLIFIF